MSNVNLVTGYAGKPHVSSVDHAALHTMIFGTDSFVLPFGSRLAASVMQSDETQARIKIADGDMMVQGRHIRIATGSYDTVTVSKPAQGYYRTDLIVVRYTKDAGGVESCALAVIRGDESEVTGTAPSYTVGDLMDSECKLHEFPLYDVRMYERDEPIITPRFTTKNPLSNVDSVPIQCGTEEIEYSTTRVTTVEVKFPAAFAKKPVVIVSQPFNTHNIVVKTENVTKTGFTAELDAVGSSGKRDFSWIAMA